jgi:hypothetical protein
MIGEERRESEVWSDLKHTGKTVEDETAKRTNEALEKQSQVQQQNHKKMEVNCECMKVEVRYSQEHKNRT